MTKQRLMRASRVAALAAALFGLLVAAAAGPSPSRATARLATPRTLYKQNGTIHNFAQDGGLMTWVAGPHYVVHLRGVSGGPGWVLGNAGPGAAVGARSASTLVLGGKQAVWVKYAGVLTREAGIYTAKPGAKRPTLIDAPGAVDFGGTYLTGLAAADERTIAYGTANVTYSSGSYSITGGGVHRIVGTKAYPHRLRNVVPPFAIATSAGRIAVVPAVLPDEYSSVVGAAPNGRVDVFDLSGNRLATVVPKGTVREVALSWPDLAVIMTRADGTTAIDRFDAARGEFISNTPTPGATNLTIGTGGIVFLVGKSIYTLHDGQAALLWRAAKKPIGLSIEGRRVAWAACGRIKALTLPR